MINKIDMVSFGAKLIPATPGGKSNKKLLDLFEQKTKDYKNFGLLQDKLNFNGKDTFYLVNKDGEKIMSTKVGHSCYSYSCIEEMADRFVEIFKFLAKDIVE